MNPSIKAALAVAVMSTEERLWLEKQLTAAERTKLSLALAALEVDGVAALDAEADPAQRDLSDDVPRLAQLVMDEPVWFWPMVGAAVGPALRQAVLAYAEQDEALSARADMLRRHWHDEVPLAAELASELRRHLKHTVGVVVLRPQAISSSQSVSFLGRFREWWHG